MSIACITLPLEQIQDNDNKGQIECDKSGTNHTEHHAQFGTEHIFWSIPERILDRACPVCEAFGGSMCVGENDQTLPYMHVYRAQLLNWRIEKVYA